MIAKRVFLYFSALLLLLTACAQKDAVKTVVVEKPVKQTQVVVEKVVGATVIVEAKATPAAGKSQNNAPTAASNDFALLNYQSSSVRMVIKDAEIELLVEDTDRAMDQVTQMAADYGGYLLSSESWFDGAFKYATIRLAVPSEAFETALTNLRHIGVKVIKETGSGEDVSAEYTDLQSRLTNLEATAARVREFLDAAQTVDESLKVNQQLSDLESQIEQIKGQMKYYEGRAAFSTITANLTPQRPTPTPSPTATITPTPTPTATPTPEPGWNPVKTINNATDVLSALFRASVDLLIWLIIVFGPFLLVLLVILWVLNRFFHLGARLRTSQRQPPSPPPAPTNATDPTNEEEPDL